MCSLLGESRVIDNPGSQSMFAHHGWKNLAANLSQKRIIAPGRIGHDVVRDWCI
jgi:hypothetical protein